MLTDAHYAFSTRGQAANLFGRDGVVPNPLDTFEQFQAFHHFDLCHLDDRRLRVEQYRVVCALARARDPRQQAWLLERDDYVRAEQRRRRWSR